MNGQLQSPRRMQRLGVWSRRGKALRILLGDLPPPVRLAFALMLIVLAGLLAGCATTSTPSSEPARNPSMPPPSQSQPSATYSSSAAEAIKSWRKLLTDTLPTH